MGVAAYNSSALPRLALAQLLDDDKPMPSPLQFARLALRKSGPRDLDRRIIQILVARQNEPGAAWTTAASIAINYAADPTLISYERAALMDGRPGAIAVAEILVKDSNNPLAGPAAIAARDLLDSKTRLSTEVTPETEQSAIALLLRIGSDQHFDFFLEQIKQAKAAASPKYQQYLLAVQSQPGLPASRLLGVARLYIDDATLLTPPGSDKPWRVCDAATTLVGRVADDDFGVKPGAMKELIDVGVERAKRYLKSKE